MGRDAKAITEKWAQRLKGATAEIERGVRNVTVSPTVKAADNIEKMRLRLMEAFDDGSVERGLRAVPLEDWQNKMINKGIRNIATGVDAGKSEMEEFMRELLPHIEAGQAKIEKMPDLTEADADNRMLAWAKHMREFKRK